MGANSRDAMNVGALQAKPHARSNVFCRPMLSILGSQAQSTIERAVWARAGNDLPFVEMGVHVDERRPDVPSADINRRWRSVAISAAGTQRCNSTAFNDDIEKDRALIIGARPGATFARS